MSRDDFDAGALESARDAFKRDGVVCIRNLLDPRWLEILRDSIQRALDSPRPRARGGAPGYFVENSLWKRFDSFRKFAAEAPVARVAGLLMGSQSVRMFNDTMFVKEPATAEPTPWHHDLPYFKLGGSMNCSVWIPLDPVTQESGAMTFVRGSHRWGKMFEPISFGKDGGQSLNHDGFDGMVPDIDAGDYDTVSWNMQPGDVTFHHLLTVHKAGANLTSSVRRRVHTIRMAGDDAVYLERPFATTEFETTLKSGDPLNGASFPILWSDQLAAADR